MTLVAVVVGTVALVAVEIDIGPEVERFVVVVVVVAEPGVDELALERPVVAVAVVELAVVDPAVVDPVVVLAVGLAVELAVEPAAEPVVELAVGLVVAPVAEA